MARIPFQISRGEPHFFEQRGGALQALFSVGLEIKPQGGIEKLFGGMARVEGSFGVLEDNLDLAAHLLRTAFGCRGEILLPIANPTGAWWQQSGDGPGYGRFAGAALTHERHCFAPVDREGKVTHRHGGFGHAAQPPQERPQATFSIGDVHLRQLDQRF